MVSMSHAILLNNMNWKSKIRRFLTAQTISQFGSSLVQYALIWKITLDTSSGSALAVSTLCGFLPQFLISPFSGVICDRYDRKKVIILSDSLIAFATAFLLILEMMGIPSLLPIYIVLGIRSLGSGIQTPATHTAMSELAPSETLQKVNGIQSSLSSASMFIAPAFSALLLSYFSFSVVLSIDLVTAFLGILVTMTISFETQSVIQNQKPHYLSDIKEGFIYIKSQKWLSSLLLYQGFLMFFISPTAFMTPLCVSRVFGIEVWRLSLAEMTYSLGMILGGILIAKYNGFPQKLKTTYIAGAFYGLCMVGMGSFQVAFLFYLVNTLIGISSPCYNAPLYATLQTDVDRKKWDVCLVF